jgi:hypothetical protein
MSNTATASQPMRELSSRSTDAKVISLVWDTTQDVVILFLDDLATGDRVRITPAPGRERYAFEHPFAYLSSLHPAAGG